MFPLVCFIYTHTIGFQISLVSYLKLRLEEKFDEDYTHFYTAEEFKRIRSQQLGL